MISILGNVSWFNTNHTTHAFHHSSTPFFYIIHYNRPPDTHHMQENLLQKERKYLKITVLGWLKNQFFFLFSFHTPKPRKNLGDPLLFWHLNSVHPIELSKQNSPKKLGRTAYFFTDFVSCFAGTFSSSLIIQLIWFLRVVTTSPLFILLNPTQLTFIHHPHRKNTTQLQSKVLNAVLAPVGCADFAAPLLPVPEISYSSPFSYKSHFQSKELHHPNCSHHYCSPPYTCSHGSFSQVPSFSMSIYSADCSHKNLQSAVRPRIPISPLPPDSSPESTRTWRLSSLSLTVFHFAGSENSLDQLVLSQPVVSTFLMLILLRKYLLIQVSPFIQPHTHIFTWFITGISPTATNHQPDIPA